MSREVMQQALEALEKVIEAFGPGLTLQQRAITALRQALETEPVFVDQEYLERRWGVSGATLERDRSLKQGMRYLKIGGSIRYRLQDVLDYEAECTVETERRKK
jgi:hypothetical protein